MNFDKYINREFKSVQELAKIICKDNSFEGFSTSTEMQFNEHLSVNDSHYIESELFDIRISCHELPNRRYMTKFKGNVDKDGKLCKVGTPESNIITVFYKNNYEIIVNKSNNGIKIESIFINFNN